MRQSNTNAALGTLPFLNPNDISFIIGALLAKEIGEIESYLFINIRNFSFYFISFFRFIYCRIIFQIKSIFFRFIYRIFF